MGRSGSGKGTQAEKMAEYLRQNDNNNIFHMESGQRFRNFITQDYYTSKLSNNVNEVGGLQPEFLSVWAWTSELIENMTEDSHLLLDGTPRRLSEAYILDSAFNFFNREKVKVIYINVSAEWASNRLRERGRHDDLDESDIQNKMNWFDTEVIPVINYYKDYSKYSFHEINGEQSVDDVHNQIMKVIF